MCPSTRRVAGQIYKVNHGLVGLIRSFAHDVVVLFCMSQRVLS